MFLIHFKDHFYQLFNLKNIMTVKKKNNKELIS